MEDIDVVLSNTLTPSYSMPVAEGSVHVFNPVKVKGMDLHRAQHCLGFE